MKSRIALIAVLATGIVMSTTGATLAVTGIAGDDDASVAQYGGVLGTQTSSGAGGGGGGQSPSSRSGDVGDGVSDSAPSDDAGDTLGDRTTGGSGDTADAADVRSTQQVASGDSRLPFTGLAVFPLLIGGVALLLTGAFMRRQTRASAV